MIVAEININFFQKEENSGSSDLYSSYNDSSDSLYRVTYTSC